MENKKAKTLYIIGVLTIVLGIIGSLICAGLFPSISYDYSYYGGYDVEETYNWSFALTGSLISFVTGVCFIGFSEVIALLQKNVDEQELLVNIFKKQVISGTDNNSNKTALQDIESNLPKL